MRPSQVLLTLVPSGGTVPRPVIATRRRIPLFPHLLVQVLQRLPHRAQLLGLLVGDVDVEFLLEAMTSSTVSRLSAPRSSMKLASDVSLSRSTPSSSTMMSLTF